MTFDEWFEQHGYNYVTTRQLALDAWNAGRSLPEVGPQSVAAGSAYLPPVAVSAPEEGPVEKQLRLGFYCAVAVIVQLTQRHKIGAIFTDGLLLPVHTWLKANAPKRPRILAIAKVLEETAPSADMNAGEPASAPQKDRPA